MKMLTNFSLNSQISSYKQNSFIDKKDVKNKQLSFNGLTKEMSKTVYVDSDKVKQAMQKYPKSKGVVGNLPSEWINQIPVEKREESIKKIYKTFKSSVKLLRFKHNFITKQMAEYQINKAFKSTGIISKNQQIKIDYIDNGVYGRVYKLKGLGENNEYVLKVFKELDGTSFHGNFAEPNAALYWQKNAGKNTQQVRFYFGDIKNGYMVNKFIDKDAPLCTKNIPSDLYGVYLSDMSPFSDGHNKIRGYCIDWGGVEVKSKLLINNKTARFVYKEIYNAQNPIKEFEKLMSVKNNNDIKLGLLESIELLPKFLRAKYFKKLLYKINQELSGDKNLDNKLKLKLAEKLSLIPLDERLRCLKLVVKNTDKEFKTLLECRLKGTDFYHYDLIQNFFEKKAK